MAEADRDEERDTVQGQNSRKDQGMEGKEVVVVVMGVVEANSLEDQL